MALKFKYKTKEEVPAEHEALYVASPDGSGFVLDAEGVVDAEEVERKIVALEGELDSARNVIVPNSPP